jgi:hypothetical protein
MGHLSCVLLGYHSGKADIHVVDNTLLLVMQGRITLTLSPSMLLLHTHYPNRLSWAHGWLPPDALSSSPSQPFLR